MTPTIQKGAEVIFTMETHSQYYPAKSYEATVVGETKAFYKVLIKGKNVIKAVKKSQVRLK